MSCSRRNFLDDALKYHARRWSIIPIRHGKTPAKHKVPALPSWKQYQTSPPSESEIREWFGKSNVDGLAVVLGPVSGDTCCRDFDQAESYHKWAASNPELARTLPTVRTPRGAHVYFRCPGCSPATTGDGELRARGQYVLLPPSHHPTGDDYAWIIQLPDGELPTVDPFAVGLVSGNRENRGQQEKAGATPVAPGISVDPAISATPVISVVPVTPRDRSEIPTFLRTHVPSGPGQHQRCNMTLARGLKLDFGLTRDGAEPYFAEWFALAKPSITEKDECLARDRFDRAWQSAKVPVLSKPAEAAWERVRDRPIPPEIAARYETPEIRLLLAIMREMQRQRPGEPFALSTHQCSAMIGVENGQVWRWIQTLVKRGDIQCTDRGKPGKPGKNAARYRYLIRDEWGEV